MIKKNGGESPSLKAMTPTSNLGLMDRPHQYRNKKKRILQQLNNLQWKKGKELSQNALMIANKAKLVNNEYTEDFAFRNGPHRDGIIRKKDGSILTIDDQLYPKDTQPERATKKEKELPEEGTTPRRKSYLKKELTTPPRWPPLLLAIQHLNLRMGHRSKSKVKAKLMRSIRKHVPRKEPIRWQPNTSRSRHIDLRLHSWTTSMNRSTDQR
jgi:hypothetical protein